MYAIAKELQIPYGNDLNDLHLDEMAKKIVSDVLFVQKHYQHGTKAVVRQFGIGKYGKEPFTISKSTKTIVQEAKFLCKARFICENVSAIGEERPFSNLLCIGIIPLVKRILCEFERTNESMFYC